MSGCSAGLACNLHGTPNELDRVDSGIAPAEMKAGRVLLPARKSIGRSKSFQKTERIEFERFGSYEIAGERSAPWGRCIGYGDHYYCLVQMRLEPTPSRYDRST